MKRFFNVMGIETWNEFQADQKMMIQTNSMKIELHCINANKS